MILNENSMFLKIQMKLQCPDEITNRIITELMKIQNLKYQ